MDLSVLALAALSVLVGAVAQGTIGLGVGLMAAPVVAMLDPTLMPGGVLILGFVMPFLTLVNEWRYVNWRDAGWLVGRGRVHPARAVVP